MKQTFSKILLGSFLLVTAGPQAHSSIDALMPAHVAYIQKDHQAMLNSIETLMKSHALTRAQQENVRDLVTKSFELNNGKLKTDLKLPKDLVELRIVTRRTQARNGMDRIVEIKGGTRSPGLIKNIEFVRYPNEEILNSANPRFEWKETEERFYLKNKNAGLLVDGLYRLVVTMKDGQTLDTWLPLIDLVVEDAPAVSQPADNETTSNRNPEVAWQFFPFLKPLAYQTKFSVEAALNNAPDYKWDVKWGFYSNDVAKKSVVIGREAGGKGVDALPTGRYEIIVNQSADRFYGPIGVSTQSSQKRTVFIR